MTAWSGLPLTSSYSSSERTTNSLQRGCSHSHLKVRTACGSQSLRASFERARFSPTRSRAEGTRPPRAGSIAAGARGRPPVRLVRRARPYRPPSLWRRSPRRAKGRESVCDWHQSSDPFVRRPRPRFQRGRIVRKERENRARFAWVVACSSARGEKWPGGALVSVPPRWLPSRR
jgi:hypothetical protein